MARVAKPQLNTKAILAARVAKARAGNAYSGALYNPAVPLQGKALYTAANTLAHQKNDAAVNAANLGIGQAQQHGLAVSTRAGQLAGVVDQRQQEALGQQQAIYDRLNQQLQGQAQTAQATIGQAGAQAQQGVVQDAGQRGAGLDGGASQALTQAYARQAANAGQSAQTAQNYASTIGANAQQAGVGARLATQMGAGETQRQIAGNEQTQVSKLANTRAQAQAQIGTDTAANVLNLRNTAFNQAVTAQTLNYKGQAAQSTAQNQAAQRDIQRAQLAINRQKVALQAKVDAGKLSLGQANLALKQSQDAAQRQLGTGAYRPSTGGGGSGGARPLTASQQRALRNQIGTGLSLLGGIGVTSAALPDDQIINKLVTGQNPQRIKVPSDAAREAVRRWRRSNPRSRSQTAAAIPGII